MVGKGQPPKKPEDVKKHLSIMVSENERKAIDNAREKTGEKLGQFIRDAAIQKAERINNQEK